MKSITVGELIKLLQAQDPNAKVITSNDYGDHCHTEQAIPLCPVLDTVQLEKSAYSQSGFKIMDPESEYQRPVSDEFYVLISSR